jgi:pyruvate dehydrogenase E1 component beta subunit
MTVMSYLGAIGAAQKEAMLADERVVIIGEDVEANVYGTTGGAGKSRAVEGDFTQQFGRNRIRNTPISEEVIVGAAIGAAMTGAAARSSTCRTRASCTWRWTSS